MVRGSLVAYAFTWNNYPSSWYEDMGRAAAGLDIDYFCGQPERKTLDHIQGYLHLSKRKTMLRLQFDLKSNDIHLSLVTLSGEDERSQMKSQSKMWWYTRKEETKHGKWEEWGPRPKGIGSRTDLESLYEDIKAGMSMEEVAGKYCGDYIRYHSGIEKLFALRSKRVGKEPRLVRTIVYYGPTTTGKSTKAWNRAYEITRDLNDIYFFSKDSGNTRRFTLYSGESCIIIDDFRSSTFELSFLKQLLDRYPVSVNTMGGSRWICAKTIIITSNDDPKDWYPRIRDNPVTAVHWGALQARITESIPMLHMQSWDRSTNTTGFEGLSFAGTSTATEILHGDTDQQHVDQITQGANAVIGSIYSPPQSPTSTGDTTDCEVQTCPERTPPPMHIQNVPPRLRRKRVHRRNGSFSTRPVLFRRPPLSN